MVVDGVCGGSGLGAGCDLVLLHFLETVLDDWLVKLELELESSMASSVAFWGENSEVDRRRLRERVDSMLRLESSGFSLEVHRDERRFWERVRMDSRPGVDIDRDFGWGSGVGGASSPAGEAWEFEASSREASEGPSRVRRCVELRVMRLESIGGV